MELYYETEDGREFCYEASYDDIIDAITEILQKETDGKLDRIAMFVYSLDENIADEYYDEIRDILEDKALQKYHDDRQAEADLRYDYYHDKL